MYCAFKLSYFYGSPTTTLEYTAGCTGEDIQDWYDTTVGTGTLYKLNVATNTALFLKYLFAVLHPARPTSLATVRLRSGLPRSSMV